MTGSLFGQYYGHWSLVGKVGTNKIRGGEFNQSYALTGEYNLSPMWGLGMEFQYSVIDPKGIKELQESAYYIGFYSSMNLMKFLAVPSSRLEVLANAGVGLGCGDWGFDDVDGNTALFVHFGPAVEFSLSRYVSIGLDLRFMFSSTNELEGAEDDGYTMTDTKTTFNGYYNANAYIRYKIVPTHRRSKHVRDVSLSRMPRY